MFDPSVGRFTSEDTLGFAAGDPNLFRYVKNNPTNATDPSGNLIITHMKSQAEAVRARIKLFTGIDLDPPHDRTTSTKWVIEAVPRADKRYGVIEWNIKNTERAFKAGEITEAVLVNRYNLMTAALEGSGLSVYVRSSAEQIAAGDDGVLLISPTDDTAERFGLASHKIGTVTDLISKPPVFAHAKEAPTTLPPKDPFGVFQHSRQNRDNTLCGPVAPTTPSGPYLKPPITEMSYGAK